MQSFSRVKFYPVVPKGIIHVVWEECMCTSVPQTHVVLDIINPACIKCSVFEVFDVIVFISTSATLSVSLWPKALFIWKRGEYRKGLSKLR